VEASRPPNVLDGNTTDLTGVALRARSYSVGWAEIAAVADELLHKRMSSIDI